MDDQTLESGTGEQLEELELITTEESSEESGSDPLDEISDEAVRAEAKKHRAIARRLEKKPEEKTPVAVATEPASSEFLTKADFYKANERKAVREATADAEVKANWDGIMPYYTPRRGKETPEDIAEDIKDAITLFNARNATVARDDSADDLSTTSVARTGGGVTTVKTPKTASTLDIKLPSQPKDWYSQK